MSVIETYTVELPNLTADAPVGIILESRFDTVDKRAVYFGQAAIGRSWVNNRVVVAAYAEQRQEQQGEDFGDILHGLVCLVFGEIR